MTRSLLAATAVAAALALTACGGGSSDPSSTGASTSTNASASASSSASPSASSSASSSASPSASGSIGTSDNGGPVDKAWAATIKKVVPPTASKSDADILAAGQKVCTDFTANPTSEGTKKIIAELQSSLGADSTQANIFSGAAMAHFCNDKSEAFMKASIG